MKKLSYEGSDTKIAFSTSTPSHLKPIIMATHRNSGSTPSPACVEQNTQTCKTSHACSPLLTHKCHPTCCHQSRILSSWPLLIATHVAKYLTKMPAIHKEHLCLVWQNIHSTKPSPPNNENAILNLKQILSMLWYSALTISDDGDTLTSQGNFHKHLPMEQIHLCTLFLGCQCYTHGTHTKQKQQQDVLSVQAHLWKFGHTRNKMQNWHHGQRSISACL